MGIDRTLVGGIPRHGIVKGDVVLGCEVFVDSGSASGYEWSVMEVIGRMDGSVIAGIRGLSPFSRVAFLVLMVAALCSPAAAQLPDLPTLSGAGVEYISDSGFFQLLLSGQLDLEGMHVSDGRATAPANLSACETCHVDTGRHIREGDGGLRAHRLRIFADVFLGDHVYTLIELRRDNGGESYSRAARERVDQAYLRVTSGSGNAGVQVGRFASPFGSYGMRHLTPSDPFFRPPLAYDYRTVMNRWRVPGDAASFSGWKDTPLDVDRPGSPQVWEVPYQWGAMVFGRLGPVDLRLAAMNSAPSSGHPQWRFDWDRLERPSWVVAARMKPTASLEVGLSYDRGPWMEEPVTGTILPLPGSGTTPGFKDFDQELFSADVTFARGPFILRGEAILDRWDVPNVTDTPTELSYSAEAQWDLMAGLFVAARAGLIDFKALDDGAGGTSDWDHDVYRYEASVGYRLARNLGLLLSAFDQTQDGASDGDATHVGLRLWWAF